MERMTFIDLILLESKIILEMEIAEEEIDFDKLQSLDTELEKVVSEIEKRKRVYKK